MIYLKCLIYLLKHKYYVFIECAKRGIILRGLLHDISKFLPTEFIPYAKYFYGNKLEHNWTISTDDIIKTGYYEFDFAWLTHQKRNRHHWQWWTLLQDDGTTKCLPMHKEYRLEMLSDWIGAGKAITGKEYGIEECNEWYLKNKNKIQLHPDTKLLIERDLGIHE